MARYVIMEIKEEEIPFVLDVAKKNNIDLLYPNIFKEGKGNLRRIAFHYDKKLLGGHVATFCLYYGDRIPKYKWTIINNVKEWIKMFNLIHDWEYIVYKDKESGNILII